MLNQVTPTTGITFLTDYFPLAVFLQSRGHPTDVRSCGTRKVFFVFENSESLLRDIEAYRFGKRLVTADEYEASRLQLRRAMDEELTARKEEAHV